MVAAWRAALLRVHSSILLAGLASRAILFSPVATCCRMDDLDEAAMTLAEVATDVESGPEVMHVSAIEVDGAALLGFVRCLLRGVAKTLRGGGPPMGLGLLLLLEVLILLSAV